MAFFGIPRRVRRNQIRKLRLEEVGYQFEQNTSDEWVVKIPVGRVRKFKHLGSALNYAEKDLMCLLGF